MDLAVQVFRQIDIRFFTFSQKECLTEYISSEYSAGLIKDITDEEIEIVSQAWNLDKTELYSIRKINTDLYESERENCYIKYINKDGYTDNTGYRPISFKTTPEYSACIREIGTPTYCQKLEDFIEDEVLKINRQLKKQLVSKGICVRPSFLK